MLFEEYTQHVSSVNLTEHQKMLLAKAATAGAIEDNVRVILGDDKLITARDTLVELELIEYTNETDLIKITQSGINIMIQDNIIDDSNQLTPSGKIYAAGKVPGNEVVEQYTFKQYLQTI